MWPIYRPNALVFFLLNKLKWYIINNNGSPRTRCAKGEPPKSIYTEKVLTNKGTNQNRQEKITSGHPCKGLGVSTSHDNCS